MDGDRAGSVPGRKPIRGEPRALARSGPCEGRDDVRDRRAGFLSIG